MSAAETLDPFADEQEYARAASEAPPSGARGSIVLVGAAELSRPLPPVPWLVQRLDLCPGAPALVAGYGFSGKTVAAQSLALSVCSGRPVWGDFSVARRGRVVHLDYEQGLRLTAERYQRLARGMDLDLSEMDLAVAALPSVTLDLLGALDPVCRAADGAALLIVDSLRASSPSLEENSSEIRRVLDLLLAVSEKTGATCLMIHHSRKPREDDGGGAKTAIRGSGAIFDACSSVFVFAAVKGQPTEVAHEKARTSGVTHEDFALEVADVEIDGDPRAGLVCRSIGRAPREERMAEAKRGRTSLIDAAVLAFVSANPGANVRAVRGNVDGNDRQKDGAIERLKVTGAIKERAGQRGARTFWAVSQ